MRLIHTTNIAFQEFPGLERPPYSVVSHRWSDDEPNHQEFLESKPRTCYGWTKILKGCEIARERGIQWLWCDTVCIDKKSSAELSEAINSMFYWYEHAFECYVFLPDVPPVEQSKYQGTEKDPYRNSAGVRFFLEDFQSSVWFTRGWALQELLAPRTVLFYNAQFDFMDSKVGLENEIALITSIHPRWLHRTTVSSAANLQQASIAERMKWAAFRQTTRLEDAAYCMMGLFDVNMPLLYGEGSKAFMRLQLEIIRKCDDESIFAWFAPDVPSWQGLLAPSPRAFRFPGNETVVVAHHQPRAPFQMTNKGLQMTLSVPDSTRMPDSGQGSVSILLPLNCETILQASNKNGTIVGSKRQMAIRVSVRMIGRSKPPIFEGRPFREQQAEHQLILANTVFDKPKEYGCSCTNGVPERISRPLKPWVVYFRQDGV